MKLFRITYSWLSIVGLFLLAALPARAHASAPPALRPQALTDDLVKQVMSGEREELVVEFRAGDRLPMTLKAEGDLLETSGPESVPISVKRAFWVRFTRSEILMSLDGERFSPVLRMLGGQVSVGVSSDPGSPASGINVLLQAFIKQK